VCGPEGQYGPSQRSTPKRGHADRESAVEALRRRAQCGRRGRSSHKVRMESRSLRQTSGGTYHPAHVDKIALLQQIYRNPARKARLLAQAAETTPDGLPSFARQNLGTRSGAYAVYVSTGSAGSHRQRPRSPGVAAVGKFAAVVIAPRFGRQQHPSRGSEGLCPNWLMTSRSPVDIDGLRLATDSTTGSPSCFPTAGSGRSCVLAWVLIFG
jgi:hypothetical protein